MWDRINFVWTIALHSRYKQAFRWRMWIRREISKRMKLQWPHSKQRSAQRAVSLERHISLSATWSAHHFTERWYISAIPLFERSCSHGFFGTCPLRSPATPPLTNTKTCLLKLLQKTPSWLRISSNWFGFYIFNIIIVSRTHLPDPANPTSQMDESTSDRDSGDAASQPIEGPKSEEDEVPRSVSKSKRKRGRPFKTTPSNGETEYVANMPQDQYIFIIYYYWFLCVFLKEKIP